MSVIVKVRPNEPIEVALKRFKKEVDNTGILQELKKREYYVKPSEQKHQKKLEAKRKNAKAVLKKKEAEKKDDYSKVFSQKY
ncbi:MAG: 30S ribosomal protein S21 [Bacillota bacterium]